MALKDIINKIKSDAQLKIKRIEQAAVEERNRIINQAKQKGENIHKDIISENKQKIEQEKNKLTVSANIELNKEILKEKNYWMDQSFKISQDKIKSLSEKEYKKFIKKQIIKSVESGNEELILSEEDYKKFGKKLVDEINKELKKANLKLSAGKISKGFILKDDKKEKNCTFEVVFIKLREQIETEAAKKLFG